MDIKFFDLDGNEITEKLAPCYVVELDEVGSEVSRKLFNPETAPQVMKVPLTNVNVSSVNATKPDKIWWIPKAEQYTLTGNLPLPDGVFMFMLEKVVNGERVVSDERELAIVKNGVVTVTGEFETKGNFIISAARLNEGLASIGKPIELEFEDIEFDVYGVVREELKTMV
ncbi:hypothetical protein [Pseudoalteromonas sp. MMG024]|uniref:hypothetical protein n=1 Tax=Pseudoalteromonas sp. MMG024 TaxID=2909980 RepID=UPI001F42DE8B|nr:hypothetical protein [Pseudoalteromonas sp. MMG024]MCF6459038.1 hypothetical protein [Pseudoalteromonas sp. MMG024]